VTPQPKHKSKYEPPANHLRETASLVRNGTGPPEELKCCSVGLNSAAYRYKETNSSEKSKKGIKNTNRILNYLSRLLRQCNMDALQATRRAFQHHVRLDLRMAVVLTMLHQDQAGRRK